MPTADPACAFFKDESGTHQTADNTKIKQTVKYDETLTLTEINAADKLGLTGSALVAYRLVAVVVHIRNNLPSGHCVCFMKRNGLWYCADDACIKECTAFEAASQQAYLLFYETADASDDPEVRV
ncbi:unnamed protein product, partial [Porites lobata]